MADHSSVLLFLCNICNHGDQSSKSSQFLILPLFHGDAELQRTGRFSAVICGCLSTNWQPTGQTSCSRIVKVFHLCLSFHVDVWLLLSKPWNINTKELAIQSFLPGKRLCMFTFLDMALNLQTSAPFPPHGPYWKILLLSSLHFGSIADS